MLYKTILFLAFNFLALAIGGIATGKGVTSDWYAALHKAPWTPPGWGVWRRLDKHYALLFVLYGLFIQQRL